MEKRETVRPQARTNAVRKKPSPAGHSLRANAGRTVASMKLVPRPKPVHVLSFIDRAIVTAGVLTAVTSASFATYMVVQHPRPTFSGIRHLMIFAQPNTGASHPIMARAAPAVPNPGIDYTATGTIPHQSGAAASPPYPLPGRDGSDGPVIKGFKLRGISGSFALVEDINGTYRVQPGSILPGAGRVLAIEWRKGNFIVVTTHGVIRGNPQH